MEETGLNEARWGQMGPNRVKWVQMGSIRANRGQSGQLGPNGANWGKLVHGDHPKDGGGLRGFYHPKGWLLKFGSIES